MNVEDFYVVVKRLAAEAGSHNDIVARDKLVKRYPFWSYLIRRAFDQALATSDN